MRQFTTPDQTAKLIGLGLKRPRNERWVLDVANESTPSIQNIVKRQDYSIGELIEMLPPTITSIKGRDNFLLIEHFYNEFRVRYGGRPDLLLITDEELVDALCRMIFMLKQYKLL